ncbi:MAG: hypothetical protein ABIJ01_07755 [Pseudomonadota bacterium]
MITKPENLARHILPASATMVWVCVMAIPIVRLFQIGTAEMGWSDSKSTQIQHS